jgi:hypothetical protein
MAKRDTVAPVPSAEAFHSGFDQPAPAPELNIEGAEAITLDNPLERFDPFQGITNDYDLRVAEERARRDSDGVWENARWLESSERALAVRNTLNELDVDEEWTLTKDKLEELMKDIPEEFAGHFLQAHSERHAQALRQFLLEDMQAEDELRLQGGWGLTARIGAALLDPGALALAVSTYGVGGLIHKASRLKRIAQFGLLAGTENALIEAHLAKSQGTRGWSDVALAGAAGLLLGGGAGAIGKGADELDNALQNTVENYSRKVVSDELRAAGLPAARANELAGVSSEVAKRNQKIIDAAIVERNADDARAMGIDADDFDDSVGAARAADAPTTDPLFKHGEFEDVEDIISTPKATGGVKQGSLLRWDIGGLMARSNNPFTRFFQRKTLVDAAGDGGKTVDEIKAEEVGRKFQQAAETMFRRGSQKALNDWKVETGNNGWFAFRKEREFYEEVTKVIRSGGVATNANVGKAAKAFQEAVAFLAEEAKRLEVKGFAKLDLKPNYVPRVFAWQRVTEVSEAVGDKNLRRLIFKSLQMEGGHMPRKVAAKIARQYVRSIRTRAAGVSLNLDRVFANQDIEDVAHILKTEMGFDQGTVDDVVALVAREPKGDAGNIARGKARLKLDESVSIRVTDKNGVDRMLSLSDMLENDASALLSRYSHQVGGAIGLARAGFKSIADIDKYITAAERYGADVLKLSPKELKRDREMMEFARDALLGRSLENDPTSAMSKFSRVMRDYNFMRVMGQVGIAQIADVGQILAHGSFQAFRQHMPEMFSMLKRIKETGKLEDELGEELEAFIGAGTDVLRGQTFNRLEGFDDVGAEVGVTTSKVGTLAHDFGQKGRQVMTKMSLMGPINVVLQRTAMKMLAQKMLNGALKKGARWSTARMRSMGLDETMARRVHDQMKKFATTEKGTVVDKLKRINLEKWDDLDARDAFTMSMWRQTRRAVQENDIGTLHMSFAKSPVMKMMVQFRSFMLTAYSKQLLHNIQFADQGMYTMFALGAMIGTMTYVGQTHMNAVGRTDRKKYLARMLTTRKIIENGFARTAYSSIIPAIAASAGQVIVGEDMAPFTYGRTSGLASGGLTQNPTIDFLDRAGKFVGAVSQSGLRSDRQFTQNDGRNALGLLLFHNTYGIRNLNNLLVSPLPEKRK